MGHLHVESVETDASPACGGCAVLVLGRIAVMERVLEDGAPDESLGSHRTLPAWGAAKCGHHPTKPGTVTIAGKLRLDIPPGTLNRIRKQAGLPRAEADGSRGRVVDAFTEHVDVMPTLLEALGCNTPAACDGASLYPFLTSPGPQNWREEVHWEYDFRSVTNPATEEALGLTADTCNLCVIRDTHFKYVHFAGLPCLLFDLRNDPGELNDLASQSSHSDTVLEYAQRMLSWRMRHADKTLTHLALTPTS